MPSPARRFEKRPSLDNLVERVDAQRPGEITGDTIPTGFGSLDKLLGGGFRRRDLILLGGDIGSGKYALALAITLRVAPQSVGVSKNRKGPTGFADLYFYRRWMRFEDMLDPDR